MLAVVMVTIMGPDVVGLTFGDRVDEEDIGSDVVELRVGLGVRLGAVGVMFGNILAR